MKPKQAGYMHLPMHVPGLFVMANVKRADRPALD